MKLGTYKFSGRHITKKQQLDGFMLSEAVYQPGLRQPRHTHELASFSFILKGSYIENYERRSHVRQPSTVIFHPPQESHSVDFKSEAVRILNVQIDFERLAHIRKHSIILDSSSVCRTETTSWLGRKLHQELRRMDALSVLSIEGLVLEILAEASRSQASALEKISPRWFEQAKAFLHDNFSKSFALKDVAEIAGVHPVHLARVFRQNYGCTIGDYIRRLRVDFACRQISTTDAPLSEVAIAAGFSDQSHLNKTFKSFFGLTPSEYRKLHRKC